MSGPYSSWALENDYRIIKIMLDKSVVKLFSWNIFVPNFLFESLLFTQYIFVNSIPHYKLL